MNCRNNFLRRERQPAFIVIPPRSLVHAPVCQKVGMHQPLEVGSYIAIASLCGDGWQLFAIGGPWTIGNGLRHSARDREVRLTGHLFREYLNPLHWLVIILTAGEPWSSTTSSKTLGIDIHKTLKSAAQCPCFSQSTHAVTSQHAMGKGGLACHCYRGLLVHDLSNRFRMYRRM